MAEMIAPIVVKNAPERKVFGPVLIPDEPDYDGDVVSAEKIEQIHDLFNEKYQNIDVQHSLQNVGKVYTSYIAPSEITYGEQKFPQGTWMMGVKVTDDKAWELVEKGILTGFSIMAINPVIGNATKGEGGRTTLADLGNDWIVNAVSLVTDPAVPRAKFVAVKSSGEENIIQKIFNGLQGILQMITSTKAADVFEKIEEVQDVTPEQVQQLIQDALAPIMEQMVALQEQLKSAEPPADAEDVEKATEEKKPEDEVPAEETPAEEKPAEDKPKEEVPAEEKPAEEVPAEEDPKKEDEELKTELQAALQKIAELENAQKSAYSKRLTGQDGIIAQPVKQNQFEDRDALGRKIKKKN